MARLERYFVGDRVEARFRGGNRYYAGIIKRCHRGDEYDIDYDDGDFESNVSARLIRKEGGGRNFDSGPESQDEDMPKRSGRNHRSVASPRRSPKKAGSDIGEKSRHRSFSPDSNRVSSARYRVGDRVEAKFRGGHQFYAGRITRVRDDGTFDIDYDDGDKERFVSAALMRKERGNVNGGGSASNRDERDWRRGDRDGNKGSTSARSGMGRKAIRELDEFFDDVLDKGEDVFGRRFLQLESIFKKESEYGDGVLPPSVFSRVLRREGLLVRSPQRLSIEENFGTSGGDIDTRRLIDELNVRSKRKSHNRSISRDNRSVDSFTNEGSGLDAVLRKFGKPGYSLRDIKTLKADIRDDPSTMDGEISIRSFIAIASRQNFGDYRMDELKEICKCFRSKHDSRSCDVKLLLSGLKKVIMEENSSEHERRNSPRAEQKQFELGDKVLAKEDEFSKYRNAEIIKRNYDGSFNVRFDTGRTAYRIPLAYLKAELHNEGGFSARSKGSKANTTLRVGDKVEAKFRGGSRFYSGKITKVRSDGSYDIAYDDGDSEKRVPKDLIKILNPKSRQNEFYSDNSQDEAFAPTDNVLKAGDRIEARFGGGKAYYPGEIYRVKAGNKFHVKYDDGDAETSVPGDWIRKKDNHLKKGDRVQSLIDSIDSIPEGGKVSKVHGDGSVDITFDNGERKRGISPAKVDKVNTLEVGTRVEARYQSGTRFYPGVIKRKNSDGTYCILYDDGDLEKKVPFSFIRSLEVNQRIVDSDEFESNKEIDKGEFEVGDVVEAKFKGGSRFFKGKITRKNKDGTFAIDYDDGDKERRVASRLIRHCGQKKSSRKTPGSARPNRTPRSGRDQSSKGFKKGDKVEAKFKGGVKYYKGTINAVNRDGTYSIKYDDGDRELRVKPELIRAIGVSSFEVGDRVLSPTDRSNTFSPGKVKKVRDNNTVDVLLDKGGVSKRIDVDELRQISESSEDMFSENQDQGMAEAKSMSRVSYSSEDSKVLGKTERFKTGDRVSLLDKNKREVVGIVSKIHRNGSCDVELSNGKILTKVSDKRLKLQVKSPVVEVGSRVLSPKKGTSTLKKASVVEVDEGEDRVVVKYDEGGKSRVDVSDLKKVKPPSIAKGTRVELVKRGHRYTGKKGKVVRVSTSGDVIVIFSKSGGEERFKRSEVKIAHSASGIEKNVRYNVGDNVEVKSKTVVSSRDIEWKSARIAKLEKDGTFVVKYMKGGKVEHSVVKERIRRAGNDLSDASIIKKKKEDLFSDSSSFSEGPSKGRLDFSSTDSSVLDHSSVSSVKERVKTRDYNSDSAVKVSDGEVTSEEEVYKRISVYVNIDGGKRYKRIFSHYDKNKLMFVELKEFIKALKLMSIKVNVSCAKRIIAYFDSSGKNRLGYKKLLNHCLNKSKKNNFVYEDNDENIPIDDVSLQELDFEIMNNKSLEPLKSQIYRVFKSLKTKSESPLSIFQKYDVDKTGNISFSAFVLALKDMGFRLDKRVISKIFKLSGISISEPMSYKQFNKSILRVRQEIESEIENEVLCDFCEDQDENIPFNNDIGDLNKNKLSHLNDHHTVVENNSINASCVKAYNKILEMFRDALKNRMAKNYEEIFSMFDLSNSGRISTRDWSKGLTRLGIQLSSHDSEALLNFINLKHSMNPSKLSQQHVTLATFLVFCRSRLLSETLGEDSTLSALDVESKLKNEILKYCEGKLVERDDIEKLFIQYDRSKKGLCSRKNVKQVLFKLKCKVSLDEFGTFFTRFSRDKDIFDYKLFLNFLFIDENKVSTIFFQLRKFVFGLVNEGSKIEDVFKLFDKNKDKIITIDDVNNVLVHAGSKFAKDALKEVFRRLDLNNDGKIGITEFRHAFKSKIGNPIGLEGNNIGGKTGMEQYFQNEGDEAMPQEVTTLVASSRQDAGETRNCIGEWLETDATATDKKNFFAFMKVISSFERSLKARGERQRKRVENGEVILPLGSKLRVALRFVSS